VSNGDDKAYWNQRSFDDLRKRQISTIERESAILQQDCVIVCPLCSGTGSGPYSRNGFMTGSACCDTCNYKGYLTFDEWVVWTEKQYAIKTQKLLDRRAEQEEKQQR
jgi:hypothetical protein